MNSVEAKALKLYPIEGKEDRNKHYRRVWIAAYKQAKEEMKEELREAFEAGEGNIDNDGCYIEMEGFEEYYNNKYGK